MRQGNRLVQKGRVKKLPEARKTTKESSRRIRRFEGKSERICGLTEDSKAPNLPYPFEDDISYFCITRIFIAAPNRETHRMKEGGIDASTKRPAVLN